ncbi:MAG: hypothetical protein ACRBK7_12000 [Acidimicrobiales bacterium]
MAAQNIYDNPDFLAGYQQLDRQVRGLDGGVVKQHRTVATYVNGVTDTGFTLDRIVEWGPTAEEVEAHPELADARHRPWFLLLRATRTKNGRE